MIKTSEAEPTIEIEVKQTTDGRITIRQEGFCWLTLDLLLYKTLMAILQFRLNLWPFIFATYYPRSASSRL